MEEGNKTKIVLCVDNTDNLNDLLNTDSRRESVLSFGKPPHLTLPPPHCLREPYRSTPYWPRPASGALKRGHQRTNSPQRNSLPDLSTPGSPPNTEQAHRKTTQAESAFSQRRQSESSSSSSPLQEDNRNLDISAPHFNIRSAPTALPVSSNHIKPRVTARTSKNSSPQQPARKIQVPISNNMPTYGDMQFSASVPHMSPVTTHSGNFKKPSFLTSPHEKGKRCQGPVLNPFAHHGTTAFAQNHLQSLPPPPYHRARASTSYPHSFERSSESWHAVRPAPSSITGHLPRNVVQFPNFVFQASQYGRATANHVFNQPENGHPPPLALNHNSWPTYNIHSAPLNMLPSAEASTYQRQNENTSYFDLPNMFIKQENGYRLVLPPQNFAAQNMVPRSHDGQFVIKPENGYLAPPTQDMISSPLISPFVIKSENDYRPPPPYDYSRVPHACPRAIKVENGYPTLPSFAVHRSTAMDMGSVPLYNARVLENATLNIKTQSFLGRLMTMSPKETKEMIASQCYLEGQTPPFEGALMIPIGLGETADTQFTQH